MATTLSSAPGQVRGDRRPLPASVVWIPALLVGALMLFPVAYLVVRAAGAGGAAWDLLASARTAGIVLNTVILAAAVTASAVALAVPLAWLTARTDLPAARVFTVLTVLPLAVPSYISGFVVAAVFGPAGILQQVFDRLGGFARVPDLYGLPGAWLTLTIVRYPYVLLAVRAGLRGLDPALEDAARSLGDGRWGGFRRVILPQLRPWIGAGALLVALYVLSDFGAVSMMRYESLTTVIYTQYQASFDRAYAAILSLVLAALAATLLLLEERRGRARYHRVGTGLSRQAPPAALGRWRIPAVAFCALVAALGVAVPTGVLGYWLAVGLSHGEPLVLAVRPAVSSLYAAALGALATVVAALPVAVLAARHGGRLASAVGRLAYVGYALPGLVVALSLVFFAARYAPVVYQTLGLLILAYVILFLPQAAGTLRSALAQVNPSQEEAARTLGRTAPQVLWSVTLPQVRPGLVAGAALVFLSVLRELRATLVLSPIGFETLATRVWLAATQGFFARAAAPALLLLLLSSLSMVVLLAQERRRAAP